MTSNFPCMYKKQKTQFNYGQITTDIEIVYWGPRSDKKLSWVNKKFTFKVFSGHKRNKSLENFMKMNSGFKSRAKRLIFKVECVKLLNE